MLERIIGELGPIAEMSSANWHEVTAINLTSAFFGAKHQVPALEARGGGGRAMMFETGPGNAQTIARYAQATQRATGGPSSNALAVFVYRLMPNGTDFTVAAQRGLAGVNLAFIGRPAQYHSPTSTPDACPDPLTTDAPCDSTTPSYNCPAQTRPSGVDTPAPHDL